MNILQTKVALDRIAKYLDEDEVTEQVSILKTSGTSSHASSDEDVGLGIENGSFKWNEVEMDKKDADIHTAKRKKSNISVDTIVASETDSIASEDSINHQFELQDISVMFPEGKLSCITGPTASGKTALLVSYSTLLLE